MLWGRYCGQRLLEAWRTELCPLTLGECSSSLLPPRSSFFLYMPAECIISIKMGISALWFLERQAHSLSL